MVCHIEVACSGFPVVAVPALRDRRTDITFLAEQFMHRMARKHGVRVQGFSKECLAALNGHDWPGNVRELQNVIERAVILCADGEPLGPDHLGLGGVSAGPSATIPSASNAPAAAGAPAGADADGTFPTLGELEKRHIFAALARCNDNRTHAAKLLDISIRTLRNKLNEYSGKTGGDGDGDGE